MSHTHPWMLFRSKPLPCWEWWNDPETIAWRARIDAWIEEQRESEPSYLDAIIARRRAS